MSALHQTELLSVVAYAQSHIAPAHKSPGEYRQWLVDNCEFASIGDPEHSGFRQITTAQAKNVAGAVGYDLRSAAGSATAPTTNSAIIRRLCGEVARVVELSGVDPAELAALRDCCGGRTNPIMGQGANGDG